MLLCLWPWKRRNSMRRATVELGEATVAVHNLASEQRSKEQLRAPPPRHQHLVLLVAGPVELQEAACAPHPEGQSGARSLNVAVGVHHPC